MDRTDSLRSHSQRRPTTDAPRRAGKDLRCGCHRLLARAIDDGIEMRCTRCKTSTVLRWDLVKRLELEARLGGGGAAVLTAPCAKRDEPG